MSSGNGGGKGFFDNLVNVESFSGGGNFFENLGSDVLNYGTQMLTGGILGYEDGKISNGVTTNLNKKAGKEVVSGTKEVTGAKAAEQANDLAREQFEEAKAGAELDRKNATDQTAREEIKKSQSAAAARATATSRSTSKNSSTGGGSVSLGDDEKDFLGL
jgi:hypothetical protein